MRFPFVRFLSLAVLCCCGIRISAIAQEPGRALSYPVPAFILDSVQIITVDVFDSTNRIPLVGGLVEQFHARTRERVIRGELFFADGDTLSQIDLDELELNLRRLTIFSDIRFEVIPWKGEEEEEIPYSMLVIRTRDAWSLRFGVGYTKTEDVFSGYLSMREVNLFGLAKQVGVSASYSDFNDRGWLLGASYYNPNIFGTHVYLGGDGGFAGNQRFGSFYVGRPFFSDRTPYAFNSMASYYAGQEVFDFRYPDAEVASLADDARRTNLGGWYSIAGGRIGDVFRASLSVAYNRTIRHDLVDVHRAFENSVSIFGGISSHRRRYTRFVNADFDGERQVAIGAAGSISIGKIAPHSGGLDNIVYVGGDARQAWRSGNFYGFVAVEAGTGLAGKDARFTTERSEASSALLFDHGTLAARFEQSTVWNWPRYLYVPVDNANGLRGYPRLQHFGDNRLLFNFEYRAAPVFTIMMFDFGAVAFYDIGSAWKQSEQLTDVRFHSSAGLGLRISNAKGQIDKGLLRIDLAFNFEDRKIARLIISSEEAFDVFGTLDYRPPAPYVY